MTITTYGISAEARSEIEEAVHTGAEFLDARNKHWYKLMKPRSLDIREVDRCVLGQIGEALTSTESDEMFNYDSFVTRGDSDFFADGCKNPRFAASLLMSEDEAKQRGFNLSEGLYERARQARNDRTGVDDESVLWGYLNDCWIAAINDRINAN